MWSTIHNLSRSLRLRPVKAAVTPHWGLPHQLCTGETHQYFWADNHLSQFDLMPLQSQSLTFLHLAARFSCSSLTRAINYPAAGSKHQQQQRAAKARCSNGNWWGLVGCARTRQLDCHDFYFLPYIWGDASQGFLALLSSCTCFVKRNGFMWHIVCVNETQTMTELLPFFVAGMHASMLCCWSSSTLFLQEL